MPYRRLVLPSVALLVAIGCGSTASSPPDNMVPEGQDAGDYVELADGATVYVGPDSAVELSDGSVVPRMDSGMVPNDAGTSGMDSGMMVGNDAGSTGGPISCPAPGNYKKNGGACGSERWNIKTGTDSMASSISMVPKPTTIAALVALPAAGGGNSRENPTETTLWELKDVTLSMIKFETDSDYHTVVSDGTHTMIVEFAYPDCATGSAWSCFISRGRAEIDGQFNVTSSPQYPSQTITVRGVGFFDFSHGQTGVAPNAIELHPVLQVCFGKGCTPT